MKAAGAVVALAMATHLAWFMVDGDSLAPDSHKYLHPAEAMLAGDGFRHDGLPETLQTPGYPVLLAAALAAGVPIRGIVLGQHLLATMLAGVAVFATARITGSTGAAWAAGIALALDVPTLHHANLILTETPFTAMLMTALWLTWRLVETPAPRPVSILSLGLLLGALPLVRPMAALFFLVVAAFVAATRRDLGRDVALTLVAMALVFPVAWTARNYHETGVASLSTNGAVLFADYHAPGALAIGDSGGFTANFERRREEVRQLADDRVRAVFAVDPATVPQAARAAVDMRVAWEILLAHPMGSARLFVYGVALNLLGGSTDAVTRVTSLSRSTVTRLLLPWNALALVLYAVGQVWLLRHHRRAGVLILATVAYVILTTAGAISYSRFRVPIVPIYAITIGCGVRACAGAVRDRSARQG